VPPRKKNLTAIEECKLYIRATRTLDEARKYAAEQNFSANTSVWLSAMGSMLEERMQAERDAR